MLTDQEIHQSAASLFSEVQAVRRHLHRYPELSFHETKTSAFLKEKLEAQGIEVKSGFAGTGLVAVIKGQRGGGIAALRGDMDALPIHEQNDHEYASSNPGVMHACGHDVHSACAYGAALLLHHHRSDWKGEVHVLFQPAEERIPGGAKAMIAEGAITEGTTGIVGQHVFPELEAGKIGLCSGRYMASTDELYFTLRGKGGHAAIPHQNRDTVLAMANMITALQQVASRRAAPDMPTVLSIGRVIADGATNIIPNTIEVAGTFRTFDETWRAKAHELIEQIAHDSCRAFGVDVEIEIKVGYPYLFNDEQLTARLYAAAESFIGADNVVELSPRMTAEDFAYFSQYMPACFYRLGTSSAGGKYTSQIHTPTFDIDEKALVTGTGMMARFALEMLKD